MARPEEDRRVRTGYFGDTAAAQAAVRKSATTTPEAPTLFSQQMGGPSQAQGFSPRVKPAIPAAAPATPAAAQAPRERNPLQPLMEAPAARSPQAPRQPLDAQAAADRRAIAAAGAAGLGFANQAGEAMNQNMAMPGRLLAKFADNAVVRPLRAAGVDAPYLTPAVGAPNAPTNPVAPITNDLARRALAGAPAGMTPDAASPTAGAAARTAAPNNTPNPTTTPAQAASQDPNAPKTDPMTGVQVGNTVQANRQPNGVMEFSGSNITSGFNYGGNAGFRPGGAGVNVMPAANFVQAPPSLQAQVAQARAQADGTAGFFSGSRGDLGGNQNATVMSGEGFGVLGRDRQQGVAAQGSLTPRPGESRANFSARLQASTRQAEIAASERNSNRTNETQRRGQDLQAENSTADRGSRERIEQSRQSLDAQRIAPEVEAAGFRNRQAGTQERLFNEWLQARTPEERATAAERLRMLQGGSGEQRPRFTVVPGGQEFDVKTGATITRPSTVFDESTRQFIQNPYATAPGAASQEQTGPRVGSISEVEGKGFAVWNGTEWVRQ